MARRSSTPPTAPPVPASRMHEPPPPTATRLLPFDLMLLMGADSLTLFPRGPFDELTFFQREVTNEHELEYVTCLDTSEGGEVVRGYGLFKLKKESEPLLELPRQRDLWRRLNELHRLHQLPDARTIMTRAPNSHDVLKGDGSGRNRVTAARGDTYRHKGQRTISTRRVLQLLRELCRPRQLIAWMERGIPEIPRGRIQHRYYLDARGNIYLVRHKYRSRRLYVPRRCEAPEVCRLRAQLRVPEWPPRRAA